MSDKQSLHVMRLILIITATLTLMALVRVIKVMQLLAISLSQPKWFLLLGLLAIAAIASLSLFGFTWDEKSLHRLHNFIEKIPSTSAIKIFSTILFVLILVFYSWLVIFSPMRGFLMGDSNSVLQLQEGKLISSSAIFGWMPIKDYPLTLNITSVQWLFFWACSITAAITLRFGHKEISFGRALIASLIGESIIYKVISYLSSISSYPFALNWEESYRIYYASLLAAKRLYGLSWPLPQLDFSLYLINGIPFLIGNFPIWVHRMWYVILLLCITMLAALSLCRRLKIRDWLSRWLFIGWCILYILQMGGIHYELLICVIIILLGFSIHHPWRSLASIVLASAWAGMSRLNWYPVPAMLAVALFFLEEPLNNYRNALHYLLRPVLWGVIGLITAIFGSLLVSHLTGISLVAALSSRFTSLLWYRLLPNPTYPLGILPAITLVSLPLLWMCFDPAKGQWRSIRVFWLTAMTLTLFAGGVIVSVKIGGGDDLHNLDAYRILLAIIAAYIFFNRFAVDTAIRIYKPTWPVIALAMVIPLWSAIHVVQPYIPFDRQSANHSLEALKTKVEQASAQGEILFTHQRQLLAFGYIHIPLVPEYEDAFLLEMPNPYLDQFYADLSDHHFQLIVADNQPKGLRGKSLPFGEENDVWFTAITQPLLCEYESVGTVQDGNIELYAPRLAPDNCEFNIP